MKKSNEEKVRKRYADLLIAFMREQGEDCDFIKSNVFNFPVVEDGEEGFVEIRISTPHDKEEEDAGYNKREQYKIAVADAEERKRKQAEEKAKKAKKRKEKEGN